MRPVAPAPERQPFGFLVAYALAAAGGAIAYVPFLTLMLPLQVERLAGTGKIDVLAYATFGGAVAASLANIGFGWASDRSRVRRPWILAGLVLSCALLIALREVRQVWQLLAMLALWQVALNMMLSPLAAWAGDCFPDEQKGTLGGMLSFAPALGAIAGVLVTLEGVAPPSRNMLVAGLVAAMILPALLLGKDRVRPALVAQVDPRPEIAVKRHAVWRMWLARLLLQIAEAALFAYAVFWLFGLDESVREQEVARMFGLAMAIAVPLALMAGRWSDRHDRPIVPLLVATILASVGLLAMALVESLAAAKASYLVFGIAGAVFLSLHSAQTLRVLPRPHTRGRDLGIFNLTNTVPSLLMPWIAIGIIPLAGFSGLFAILAGLAILATLLLASLLRRI